MKHLKQCPIHKTAVLVIVMIYLYRTIAASKMIIAFFRNHVSYSQEPVPPLGDSLLEFQAKHWKGT